MIDIENEIYDGLATHIRTKYPNISISSDYNPIPSNFPHVEIQEIDNRMLGKYQDTSGHDRLASVSYQIDVYSNKRVGRKAEVKEISAHIDEWLVRHNFRRTYKTVVPNSDNSNIYRMIFRYIVATDGTNLYKR